MRIVARALVFTVAGLVSAAPIVSAEPPPPTTFVAVLNADDEVPHCEPSTNASRGVAIFHVLDAETGLVSYRLVANNLPGELTAAHIHLAPFGVAGAVVQPLALNDEEQGVIGTGTFTNPSLVAALQEDSSRYYVNVHTDPDGGCPTGVIRGQLG